MACTPVVPISVITIQQALWARAFQNDTLPDPGPIDGRWGNQTLRAFAASALAIMPGCLNAVADATATPATASMLQVPVQSISRWGALAREWATSLSTRARESGFYPYGGQERPNTGASIPSPAPSLEADPPPQTMPYVPSPIPPGIDPVTPYEVAIPRPRGLEAFPIFVAGAAALMLGTIAWVAFKPKRRRRRA